MNVKRTTKKAMATVVWVILNLIEYFAILCAPSCCFSLNSLFAHSPFPSRAIANVAWPMYLYQSGHKVLHMAVDRRAVSKCTLISFSLAACQDLDISALARTGCSLHFKGKKRVKIDSTVVTKSHFPFNALLILSEVSQTYCLNRIHIL